MPPSHKPRPPSVLGAPKSTSAPACHSATPQPLHTVPTICNPQQASLHPAPKGRNSAAHCRRVSANVALDQAQQNRNSKSSSASHSAEFQQCPARSPTANCPLIFCQSPAHRILIHAPKFLFSNYPKPRTAEQIKHHRNCISGSQAPVMARCYPQSLHSIFVRRADCLCSVLSGWVRAT